MTKILRTKIEPVKQTTSDRETWLLKQAAVMLETYPPINPIIVLGIAQATCKHYGDNPFAVFCVEWFLLNSPHHPMKGIVDTDVFDKAVQWFEPHSVEEE